MSNPGQEKRRSRRYPCQEKVLIDGSILFKSIDISEGGLYIYTGMAFDEKRPVEVTFLKRNFSVKARIRHRQPGIGMGLQFVQLTDQEKQFIQKLIGETLKERYKDAGGKRKVLLIEDDDLKRSIYKGKLLMEGLAVTEAKDGVEALGLMKQQPNDLVILDLNLKKIDGMKFLSILKEDAQWKQIPVIVCSTKGTHDVISKVLAAGADEFLHKMVTTPAKLAETAKAVIRKRAGRERHSSFQPYSF